MSAPKQDRDAEDRSSILAAAIGLTNLGGENNNNAGGSKEEAAPSAAPPPAVPRPPPLEPPRRQVAPNSHHHPHQMPPPNTVPPPGAPMYPRPPPPYHNQMPPPFMRPPGRPGMPPHHQGMPPHHQGMMPPRQGMMPPSPYHARMPTKLQVAPTLHHPPIRYPPPNEHNSIIGPVLPMTVHQPRREIIVHEPKREKWYNQSWSPPDAGEEDEPSGQQDADDNTPALNFPEILYEVS